MSAAELFVLASFGSALLSAQDQKQVNADAALIEDFDKRIAGYLKLRKTVESGMSKLKPTNAPDGILRHEHELGHRIRSARAGAKQGSIFTPEITGEFRRLIALAMKGSNAEHVHTSLRNAEPVRPLLRVNESYPHKLPLQSTPPSILLNLPGLPRELEYRIDGHDLALRDLGANLIVDIAPNVIP